jgi:ribonuclease E
MHVSQFVIERAAEGEIASGGAAVVHMDWAHHQGLPAAPSAAVDVKPAEGEEQSRQRSRRRRRRGRRPEGGANMPRSGPPQSHVHAEPHDDDEDERAEGMTESAGEDVKSADKKDEGGAQARKGPRRRGRRGGRRGRQGQRPPETAGDGPVAEAGGGPSADSDVKQNGVTHKPRSEPARKEEAAKARHHEAERVFETVNERTPPSEARAENQGEPEAPRRRGWWQR